MSAQQYELKPLRCNNSTGDTWKSYKRILQRKNLSWNKDGMFVVVVSLQKNPDSIGLIQIRLLKVWA